MVSQPNLNMYRPGSVARPAGAQVILLTANHAPLRFNGSSIARQLAPSPNAFLSARKCRLGAGQIADKLKRLKPSLKSKSNWRTGIQTCEMSALSEGRAYS